MTSITNQNCKISTSAVIFASGIIASKLMHSAYTYSKSLPSLDGLQFFPQFICRCADSFAQFNIRLDQLLNFSPVLSTTFSSPIIEEVAFRFIFQNIVLRRLPKIALPNHVNLIDGKVGQVARVALTAAAFSALHVGPQQFDSLCYNFLRNHVYYLFGGLLTSIMYEKTNSLASNILFHMGLNLLPAFSML